MIDDALVALWAADSGILAQLQTAPAAAAPGWTPQNAMFQVATPPDKTQYPCLSYSMVGGSAPGAANDSRGSDRQRVQLDCWGTTPEAAKALADAVMAAFDGYSGVLEDGTVVSRVQRLHRGIDFFSSESLFFRRLLEFYVFYTLTN